MIGFEHESNPHHDIISTSIISSWQGEARPPACFTLEGKALLSLEPALDIEIPDSRSHRFFSREPPSPRVGWVGTKIVYCSLGASTPTESAQLITAREHVHVSKQHMDMPARLQGANMLGSSRDFSRQRKCLPTKLICREGAQPQISLLNLISEIAGHKNRSITIEKAVISL